jgi:hypothetical protein
MKSGRAWGTAVFLSYFLLSSSNAWAKKVSVEWKPIKGAVFYEIQVIREGKVFKAKKTKESSWSGDLPFGLYEYHIRAVDKVHRPGKWSALRDLVAMPKVAENVFPKDGKKFSTYVPTSEVRFSWKTGDGADGAASAVDKYHLVVKKNDDGKVVGKVVIDEVVKGNETETKKLPPGKYEWQVTGVIEKRGLASLQLVQPEKKWENQPSSASEFTVEKLQIEAPDLIYPLGTMRPPKTGKIHFRWHPVAGAEAYQIILTPEKTGKQLTWVSKTPSSTLSMAREGAYKWQVRGLASVELGAQSNAEFALDRNSGFWNGNGQLSFSTAYAPYNYSATSPNQNLTGHSSSAETAVTVAGEYWIKPQFGLGLSFTDNNLKQDGQSFDFTDIRLDTKYRVNLTPGSNGWCLTSSLGVESRDYVMLGESQVGGLYNNSFGTFGPQTGVELRKQMSERLSLAAMVNYYFPVGNQIVRGGDSNRNLGAGISATDFLTQSWGLSIGIYHENLSVIHRSDDNGGLSSDPDTVSMDTTFFFGSLVYSFGRE